MPSQEQQSLRPRLWVWGNSTLSEKVCGTEFEFSQRERRRLRGILRFAENGGTLPYSCLKATMGFNLRALRVGV